MALARKFGTFGGVFTPAILSILGVIMYMRLPWIVGNGGLWITLGIILVAHVVSVTTGLSVSSIATDKRVKAGGAYYILSRSLGLPIGATLGIALFVGLSFSVSLYLIGFAESYLGYWGFTVSKDALRLTGSIVLVVVSVVTLISTALAIKIQYWIMAAIALSLLSIFLGGGQAAPAAAHLEPLREGASIAVLFGIFFPAVTGFTAGVNMSGDLRDPNRAIPVGTLAAIAVGLVVYAGLATFLAYRISPAELVRPGSLLTFSLSAPLVVAGIWGATLSSALGSILGAPRILQACALDGIGPRFFGRGHGVDNEPRNALVLTFVIAEGGILIGELDAIARIVSMFFLTTYGFINLSCAIESWVSPDFRPQFRIPKLISVIGAVACFVLMIQLDFVAMLGAVAIMLLMFLYFKRKQLTLETGDTWTGVWSSLVRTGVQRLLLSAAHERNWRPNVVLFTSREANRQPLLELGQSLVQERGVLTEFHLVTASSPQLKPLRAEAVSVADVRASGLFSRRVETKDPWETMAAVCRYHGFSGLEPNTVMVTWEILREDPERAIELLGDLQALQQNQVVVVQPRELWAPAGSSVDVWCRGPGTNLALSLGLVRFLTDSDTWRTASVRFLATTPDAGLRRSIEQRLAHWLREARVEAQVRVPDADPDEPLERLLERFSQRSSLLIVGLSDRDLASRDRLVRAIEASVRIPGAALFVRAGAGFQDPFPQLDLQAAAAVTSAEAEDGTEGLGVSLPEDPGLAVHVLQIRRDLESALAQVHTGVWGDLVQGRDAVLAEIQRLVERAFGQLGRASEIEPPARRRRPLARIQAGLIDGVHRTLAEYESSRPQSERESVSVGLTGLRESLRNALEAVEEEVVVHPVAQPEPEAARGPTAQPRRRKPREVPLRRHVEAALADLVVPATRRTLEEMGHARHRAYAGLEALVSWVLSELARVAERIGAAGSEGAREAEEAERQLTARLEALREQDQAALDAARRPLGDVTTQVAEKVADLLSETPREHPRLRGRAAGSALPDVDALTEEQGALLDLHIRILTRARLDVSLRALHHELREMVRRLREEISTTIERGALADLGALGEQLSTWRARLTEEPAARLDALSVAVTPFDDREVVSKMLEAVEKATPRLPENVEILTGASFQALEEGRVEEVEHLTIAVRRLVGFLIETELVGALQEDLARLGEAVRRAGNVSGDVLRLISAEEIEAPADEALVDLAEERLEIAESSVARVTDARAGVEAAWDQLKEAMARQLEAVIERSQSGAISQSAGELTHFIRTYERQRLLSGVGSIAAGLRETFRRASINLLYRWSRGVLLARRLSREPDPAGSRVEKLLALHRASAPSREVLAALPIFYREVFVGRAAGDRAYWLEQEEELARAAVAVSSHRDGRPGALLLSGPPRAGSSTLARRVAAVHFAPQRTFLLQPPEGGSVDPAVFDRALARALGVQGDSTHAMSALPTGSALIIQDLELWWERREGGLAVIEHIENLIDAHGDRCLFILSGNEHTLGLLGRLGRLSSQLLATVTCRPFDTRQLREAIKRRHAATGLELRLEGAKTLSEWRLARLFSGLFDYSGGYVGAALAGWIGHILRADGQAVELQRPRSLTLDALEGMDPDWVALLIEMLLHKRMDRARLGRVTGADPSTLRLQVNALRRSGLLAHRPGSGVLELDRYVAHHVEGWLRERGLL